MKLIGIFLLVFCLYFTTSGYAKKINISEKNASLDVVFKELKKQTNYTFLYTKTAISKANRVNIELVNASLNEALEKIFLTQPLNYIIYNQMVIINEKTAVVTGVKDIDPIISQQQEKYDISGVVTDEKGQPVFGAIVFLTGTKITTSTDISGKFILSKLFPGNYELVVKMLGFEAGRQSIKLQDKSDNISIKLKENNILLKTVTIKGISEADKQYLELFTTNFIGSSANASLCKILNPDVLNFTKNKKKNTLQVNADDFLEIENNALGYKIKYLLKKFIYYFEYDICYYDGDPYYEEMKGTPEQQKQWDDNRKIAYLGSYRHFFRTIMNNRSVAEGFYVYKPKDKLNPNDQTGMKPVDIDTLLKPVNRNFKELIAKPIVFNKKDTIRRTLYVFYMKAQPQQLTRITQFADTILIDKNGGLVHGMDFSLHGKWGEKRVADLTPLEYFVDPAEEKNK